MGKICALWAQLSAVRRRNAADVRFLEGFGCVVPGDAPKSFAEYDIAGPGPTGYNQAVRNNKVRGERYEKDLYQVSKPVPFAAAAIKISVPNECSKSA